MINDLISHEWEHLPFIFQTSSDTRQKSASNKRVITLHIQSDPNKAASIVDVICTCTNTNTPLFDGKSVKPGTHVNCIGSYRHDMQEVDSYLVSHSKMIADDAESVWYEASDVIIPLKEGVITRNHIIVDNLGHLNEQAAKEKIRTQYDSDITLFKCVGMTAQDAAIANVIWKNLESFKNSVGIQQVDIE